MGTCARSAQTSSCSPAAARKVSPAPRSTDFPACPSRAASLPTVVVLPVPFTPTTMTTWGGAAPGGRSGSPPWPASLAGPPVPRERILSISSRSAAFTLEGSVSSRRASRSRTDSRRCVAVCTPTSAEKRISSSSASMESSRALLVPRSALSRATNPPRVLASPSARVRPASASASFVRCASWAVRARASSAWRASRSACSLRARACACASRRAFSSASLTLRAS